MTLGSFIASSIYKRTSHFDLRLPSMLNRFLCPSVAGDLRLPGLRGCGQWVHPDIVNLDGKIFLAATAYPFGRDIYEEPEIFQASNNGGWERIQSFSLSGHEVRRYHLSDPDMFIREDKLHLLFRKCLRRSCEGLDEILLSEIPGGEPRIVLSGPKASLLSPAAFERADGTLAVLFVDCAGSQQARIVISNLESSGVLSSPIPVDYQGPDPWHVDVAWIGGILYALLVARAIGDLNTKLLLMEGHSNGLRWDLLGEIMLPFDDVQAVYRSTFLSSEEGGCEIIASYRDSRRRWRLGRSSISIPECVMHE